MQTKILFIVPYPIGKAPSQRFRVEQFLPLLDKHHINYKVDTFLDERSWQVLYKGGNILKKVLGIIKGYLLRWKTVLLDAPTYTHVFIHREAAPLGPPVFEWILSKVLRKNIIYDFDDAIWIPNISEENNLIAFIKNFGKVKKICKWATIITAGNQYLAAFAKQNNAKETMILPTVVDTDGKYIPGKNEVKGKEKLVVGWTGSHSTLKYLDQVVPVINRLQKKLSFTFLVIADKKPQLELTDFEFVQWSAATEISDLSKIDIGIMPLTNDKWSEGKCGFKLIQYMALEITAIASPVGVNNDIIDHEKNGFLAASDNEWEKTLELLLTDHAERLIIGKEGRKRIIEKYSLASQAENFITLFRNND